MTLQNIVIYHFDFIIMKKNTIKILRFVIKYLLPALLGWLEGDSHAVQDSLSSLIGILF